jgi:hypothetical protein
MAQIKIVAANGKQYDAAMDTLPQVGNRLMISTGMPGMGPEVTYEVKQIDFHLNGAIPVLESITISVA